jgi:hypothetical protein
MKRIALVLLISSCVIGCQDKAPTPPPTVTPVAAATPPTGYWQVDSDTNAVTGEITKTAYLKFQGKQNIFVRQRGRKLECFITTDDFLETLENEDSRNSTVQYKFDNGKVIRQTWSVSANNESLFYPGTCSNTFLTQMQHAKTLAIEYRPADIVPKTITFDVTGFPNTFSK